MDRRHFLGITLGAGGLGGCTALQDIGEQQSEPATNSTENMTDTTDTDGTEDGALDGTEARNIELEVIEAPPDSVPVTVGVGIQEGEITAEQVGRLEIAFIATESVSVRTDFDAPVGKTLSDEDTPGLVLLPPKSAEYYERVDASRWKPDRPADEDWSFKATSHEASMTPNHVTCSDLEVWADHRYNGYFESGLYRFSHRFWVDDDPVEWSFTLEVSNPT